MNKKLVFSTGGIFLLSAIAVSAYNGGGESFFDLIEKYLGYVFVNLADKIDVSFYIWIKVMLWVFLFSMFYALTWIPPISKVFERRKSIQTMVALVLSLISVVMIPNAMVEAIAKTYGFIASFIFIGLPVIGILFMLYKGFPTGSEQEPGTNRVNHIIKMILFYLLATVIHNFLAAIAQVPGWTATPGWVQWGNFAEVVCIIMMFYHLFAAIFSFGKETEAGEEVSEAAGSWWSNLFKPKPPYPRHLKRFISEIKKERENLENNLVTFRTVGNKILTDRAAGNPVDINDIKQMRSLQIEFVNSLQKINNNNAQLVNDPNFNNLTAGDRNRLAQEITKATIALINIYTYTNNFFQRYARRLGP